MPKKVLVAKKVRPGLVVELPEGAEVHRFERVSDDAFLVLYEEPYTASTVRLEPGAINWADTKPVEIARYGLAYFPETNRTYIYVCPEHETGRWRHGWKVLRGRCSAVESVSLAGRRYPKDVRVEPRPGCGALTVFESRDRARDFADNMWFLNLQERLDVEVVPCVYLPSGREKGIYRRGQRARIGMLPDGTVLADAVVCLE